MFDRLPRLRSAWMMTLPPSPPSPPSGPPRGMWASRRKLAQPFPPSPALQWMETRSTNMDGTLQQFEIRRGRQHLPGGTDILSVNAGTDRMSGPPISKRISVARGLRVHVVPFHGLIHGLDAEDDGAALEDADGTGGLRDRDGDGVGGLGDRSRGPMAGAETFRERQAFGFGIEDPASRDDVAVGRDDERTIDLGKLFDALADARVRDRAVFLLVAAEGVVNSFVRHRQDLAVIADDEERADRLAFATFAPDLDGKIDDAAKGSEGNGCFEPLEVSCRQFGEVFGETDDADGVDVLAVEAGVERDDAGACGDEVISDGFDQGDAELDLAGLRLVAEHHAREVILG